MRTAVIAIWCLILVATARSSVKVEPLIPQQCSDHVRLVVRLDGKPLKGAKINLYREFYAVGTQTRPLLSLTSNEGGTAMLAKLSSGNYKVYVGFEGIRSIIFDGSPGTWLYLHINHKRGISSIAADLTEAVQQFKSADADFERQFEEAEQTSGRDSVSSFRGIFVDPSGAHIPDVKISVTQVASGVRTTVLRVTSDSNGQFSDQLKDGPYVALFSVSGFRVAIVPFEINATGSQDLKVRLDVGPVTE